MAAISIPPASHPQMWVKHVALYRSSDLPSLKPRRCVVNVRPAAGIYHAPVTHTSFMMQIYGAFRCGSCLWSVLSRSARLKRRQGQCWRKVSKSFVLIGVRGFLRGRGSEETLRAASRVHVKCASLSLSLLCPLQASDHMTCSCRVKNIWWSCSVLHPQFLQRA